MYTRRVIRVGSSISTTIPAELVRLLGINEQTVFYVCRYGDGIAYMTQPPPRYFVKVKARIQARSKSGAKYYALTIPSIFARMLGIKPGENVVVQYNERIKALIVKKAAPVSVLANH